MVFAPCPANLPAVGFANCAIAHNSCFNCVNGVSTMSSAFQLCRRRFNCVIGARTSWWSVSVICTQRRLANSPVMPDPERHAARVRL
jgi:hypothetical protein